MSSITYIGKKPDSIIEKMCECLKPKEILFDVLVIFGVAITPFILYILAFRLAGLM